jgi:hypothetical protein
MSNTPEPYPFYSLSDEERLDQAAEIIAKGMLRALADKENNANTCTGREAA